jgi:hypothetical protein
MYRLIPALIFLTVISSPVLAKEIDPEPPMPGATVKSGELTIKMDRKGNVTARNKDRDVWRVNLGGKEDVGQLAAVGDRLVVAREGVQAVLEVGTGKMIWRRVPRMAKAKMTINGDRITMTSDDGHEVFDLLTGKLLELARKR